MRMTVKVRPEQAANIMRLQHGVEVAQARLDAALAVLLDGVVPEPYVVVGGDVKGAIIVEAVAEAASCAS